MPQAALKGKIKAMMTKKMSWGLPHDRRLVVIAKLAVISIEMCVVSWFDSGAFGDCGNWLDVDSSLFRGSHWFDSHVCALVCALSLLVSPARGGIEKLLS